MERKIRGNLLASLGPTVAGFDSPISDQIRAAISDEDWDTMARANESDWYPLDVACRVQRAIFEAGGGGMDASYKRIVSAGGGMADSSLHSFLRLVVKLMTPRMLANRWPVFWGKSYNFGLMTSQTDEFEHGRFSLLLNDVDDYPYLGPLAVGFISTVLKAMGVKSATVTESLCPHDQAINPQYRVDVALR